MNDEEKQRHEKIKKKLKTAGIVLIIIGAVCFLAMIIDLSVAIGNGAPKLFFLGIIGLPLIGFGAMLLLFSARGDIMRFVKNESVPVINEAGEEIKPAVRAVTSAVREGLTGEVAEKKANVCPKCGAKNQPENRFCDKCGALIRKVCLACGADQDGDDKFCGQCGAKLD